MINANQVLGSYSEFIGEQAVNDVVGNLFSIVGLSVFGDTYYGLRLPYVLLNFFTLLLTGWNLFLLRRLYGHRSRLELLVGFHQPYPAVCRGNGNGTDRPFAKWKRTSMKILAVSDTEIGFIYSPMICERFADIDLVISCGDLPYYYLEYIIGMLNVPLYYVRGNHASKVEYSDSGAFRTSPWGAIDLHQRGREDDTGLLLAGLEGCLRYNNGPHQYSQSEYWMKVWRLVPRLMFNKLKLGRYLDVFVTHAPPYHIHDADDLPHQGIKAFNWLIKVFRPAYHLHGHIHIYRHDIVVETMVDQTKVINTYGYKVIQIETPVRQSWNRT